MTGSIWMDIYYIAQGQKMKINSNPFAQRYISAPNTFLLNYGEQNLTVYHSLTRIRIPNRTTKDLRAQLNIVDRFRKQAYGHLSQEDIHADAEALSETSSNKQKEQYGADYFWKNLPKCSTCKTINNPFIGSDAYSHYGVVSSKAELPSSEVADHRPVIRKELRSLKDMMITSPKKPTHQGEPIKSLTTLYNSRSNFEKPVERQISNGEQFTFRESWFKINTHKR